MPKFKELDRVLVRKNSDIFIVTGVNQKRSRKDMLRYNLIAEKTTFNMPLEETEAYESDLTLAPAPEPVQELSLAPDPHAPGELAALLSDGPVTSGGVSGHGAGGEHDAGTFGGEPDAYSPGAQETPSDAISDAADGPDVSDGTDAEGFPGGDERFSHLRKKWLREYPMSLNCEFQGVIYRARFQQVDGHRTDSLEDGTPVEVFVTEETNGYAVWVRLVDDGGESFPSHLERFYPHFPTARTGAIEHGVGLARGLVPVSDEELEILLLQLP